MTKMISLRKQDFNIYNKRPTNWLYLSHIIAAS